MTEKMCSDFRFEKELLNPYYHILQVKGKEQRVKIILAFNYWFKVPKETLQTILDGFNLFYNGGLLVDDIQDNSIVRRGLPAAHCVYGLPLAVNASFHAVFLAQKKIMDLSPKAGKILCDHQVDVIRGQGLDIYWRENFICPTEEEYKYMIQRKTAAYFLMAIRILQLFSENKTDYTKLISLLGEYYQIRDDYCNLNNQEALEEWPLKTAKHLNEECFSEDLTEGKFSLTIIHALKTPQGDQIRTILRQRTRDVAVKKHCMSLLEKAGSFQYTRDVLRDLDAAARAEVSRLGGNPEMEALLDEMLSWRDRKTSTLP